MIISKTPFRISFIGGGTDIPAYFRKKGGLVLVTTINQFTYNSIKKPIYKRNYKYNISYSQIDNANNLKNIRHPLIREIIKRFKIKNLDINHNSDLPGQSGLGTSSAFGVGLLKCIYKLLKKKISKKKLAKKVIHIERNILKEKGGYQDQISASYGGFNKIIFQKNNNFVVKKIIIKKKYLKELERRILITLIPRKLFSYDHSVAKILHKKTNFNQITKIHQLAIEAEKYLKKGEITTFANLIDQSWQIKSKLQNTSNVKINNFYSKIKKKSLIDGGKLLGAGGGGYFMLIAKKNCLKKLQNYLLKNNFSSIRPKFYDQGSKIIYNTK